VNLGGAQTETVTVLGLTRCGVDFFFPSDFLLCFQVLRRLLSTYSPISPPPRIRNQGRNLFVVSTTRSQPTGWIPDGPDQPLEQSVLQAVISVPEASLLTRFAPKAKAFSSPEPLCSLHPSVSPCDRRSVKPLAHSPFFPSPLASDTSIRESNSPRNKVNLNGSSDRLKEALNHLFILLSYLCAQNNHSHTYEATEDFRWSSEVLRQRSGGGGRTTTVLLPRL
jgi:hypothetical protein